jgi:spore coat polysaccharide biosynthesis protein SpsF (cytidylyltransferase family)
MTVPFFKSQRFKNERFNMILGIIPARFGSSRLFGKPLSLIGDKPMIQHTYESASKSRLLTKLVVAVVMTGWKVWFMVLAEKLL